MPAGRKEIDSVVQVKVVVSIEVSSNEVVDFLFVQCMLVLELMYRRELDDIKAIWQYAIYYKWLEYDMYERVDRTKKESKALLYLACASRDVHSHKQ